MARLSGMGVTEDEAVCVKYFGVVGAEGMKREVQVERTDEESSENEAMPKRTRLMIFIKILRI